MHIKIELFKRFIVALTVCVSCSVSAAKTYIVSDPVAVFNAEQGEQITTWPQGTLFTSAQQNDLWITVSGHFPKGKWRALTTPFYIKKNDKVTERIPYQNVGGRTIVYPALEQRYVNTNARKLKLLESTTVYSKEPDYSTEGDIQVSEEHAEIWQQDAVFTSGFQNADYIKVTGLVENGQWLSLDEPRWILKPVKVQDRTQPKPYLRDENVTRIAVIDKQKFYVTVYEVINDHIEKLMRAPVALGYDRCLSAEKGGQCYYTPEGQFDIEFKLFDADGIHWCVPPKMAAEYKTKTAKGERCWRGVMGRHALNFDESLFLHGTSNPNSIGGNTTHGCIRLRNSDIAMVYRLLTKGDKVLISDTPEQYDLLAIANTNRQENTEKDSFLQSNQQTPSSVSVQQ
ncbi:MAG: L,D-transpeptidase [Gammaproteobacteria bacterium]|nr:L,D-transpeptidase [Gammaproteobacteria bacterium]